MNKPLEIQKMLKSMALTHKNKNGEYGDSFSKTFKEYGMTSAIVRMTDKMERIKALANVVDQSVVYESKEDNLLDLALYAIMTVAEIREEREEQQIQNADILSKEYE